MSTQVHDAAVLSCWKEIAQYMGKGIRTVQRWEQDWGLPVRRIDNADHKSAIAAYPAELEGWLHSSWHMRTEKTPCSYDLEPESHRIVQEVNKNIRISRALRRELATARLEHRRLSQEIFQAVHALMLNNSDATPPNEKVGPYRAA